MVGCVYCGVWELTVIIKHQMHGVCVCVCQCVSCTCVVSQGCSAFACPSAVCGGSSEASVSVWSAEPLSVQTGFADAGSLLPTSVFTGLQECPQMSCASVMLPERNAFGLINLFLHACMHLDVFVRLQSS